MYFDGAVLTTGDGAVLTIGDGAVLTIGDGAVLTWGRFDRTPQILVTNPMCDDGSFIRNSYSSICHK